ncbi:regulator of chromosome condensation 1/beta-lactamase-inhibitor protein II [Pelagophyceae sp. CCMP2097]|nr:regulator of chromosome condensation 1/beta-lactamase-inhibitor protein II [Pelagophyceae sp. CCMP2097]
MAGVVSSSAAHALRVGNDGSLESWALLPSGNRFGQLCSGRADRATAPGQAHALVVAGGGDAAAAGGDAATAGGVAAAAAGGRADAGHSVFATRLGAVFACGCDRWQQLGLGSGLAGGGYTWKDGRIWQPQPCLVAALAHAKIVDVAAGADHSVALADNGTVFTWGRGDKGQLSASAKPFLGPPRKCDALSSGNTVAVAAEGDCTCAWLLAGAAPGAPGDAPTDAGARGRAVCIGACARLRLVLTAQLVDKAARLEAGPR